MITRIYFWRIPKRRALWAIARMALDRGSLKRNSEIGFWKLLGTGKGETFTPRDADATRWGLLITISEAELESFESSKIMQRWNQRATSNFSGTLRAISVHGTWSKKSPFDVDESALNWTGPIAAITRARIKTRKNFVFWRSVPPVTTALHQSDGLVSAIGIGEAPLGLQGTFSIWRDAKAVREFAYRGAAHQAAIAATAREAWYAEELFARFALVDQRGAL